MAHYALIDESNVVIRVFPGKDEWTGDWEAYYSAFFGKVCLRTSYNTRSGSHRAGGVPFRGNYAAPGYVYDPVRDAFLPRKPYPSWTLDEQKYRWEPPVPRPSPTGNTMWCWNEGSQVWFEAPLPE